MGEGAGLAQLSHLSLFLLRTVPLVLPLSDCETLLM